MIGHLVARIAGGIDTPDSPSLRVRIFRSICAATAILSLFVAMPMNLFQNIPLAVHVVTILLGLSGALFFWLSRRDRHHYSAFLLTTLALLDVMWFWNAGTQGSITYFFPLVLIFSLALFRARSGWLLVVLQLANIGVLFALERVFPGWVTPFQSDMDRLIDLSTSVTAACLATALMVSIVLASYDHERRRQTEAAKQLALSETWHRTIFNATSDALFVHAPDGRLLDLNDQACALFGFDRETGLRLSFDDCSLGQSPFSSKEARERVALAFAGQPQVSNG